jgi:F-type H+-transporting ATPase subunit gamma
MTIGKKGSDILRKRHSVIADHSKVYDELTFENVAQIAEELMALFAEGTYDKIVLVYNKFKNAATQILMTEQFLPIVSQNEEVNVSTDYIFEPVKEEIVKELIPKSLKTQLYKSVRDSFASEHGARMTAMHKATDNASELRDQLKLTYNKARQAAITNEILEIVGGAEALNN